MAESKPSKLIPRLQMHRGKKANKPEHRGMEQKSSMILVQYSLLTRQLVINGEAIELLRNIRKPVAMVGICGPYRSGKSYFMSKLMGSEDFKVSHSMEPCTKGIWISTTFKELEDCTLVGLDTEGIGAAQASEGSSKEEVMKYLILTTLLCSYLIYNAKGAVAESHLHEMSCFGELSQSILISEANKHDDLHQSDLYNHFPDFLWLMRDCDLDFSEDEEVVSAKDYLYRRVLVVNTTGQAPLSTRDRIVKSILTIFPKIECLHVTSPGPGISKPKKQIDPEFHTHINAAVKHIMKNVKAKHTGFNEKIVIKGPMLASLLEHYVDALNMPNTIPNLEVCYQTAVETTLKSSMFEGAKEYEQKMNTLLKDQFPMEEGDLAILERTYKLGIEEASQTVVKAVKLPPSVHKSHTLLQIHELVFNHELSILTAELHRLIPNSPDQSEKQQKKRELLNQYRRLIIEKCKEKIAGGYLYQFVEENKRKSEDSCKSTFEKLYEHQANVGKISLEQLKIDYFKQAVGPMRDSVFESLSSKIPGAPQALSVKATDNTATITWRKPAVHPNSAEKYCIQWYRDGHSPQEATVYLDCQHELHSLYPKTKYTVRVCGKSNKIGELSEIIFETEPGRPDTPDIFTVTPDSDESISLELTMPPTSKENGSPITYIHVSRCSNVNSEWKLLKKFPAVRKHDHEQQFLKVETKCEDNEKTLLFQIQFENEAGLSEPSKTVTLKAEYMIPGRPENIEATIESRHFELMWKPPKNNPGAVKQYHVEYWDSQKPIAKTEKTTKDRSIVIESLVPNTKYFCRMYASNVTSKQSEFSEEKSVLTQAARPNQPQLIFVKPLTATTAVLTFIKQRASEVNGSEVTHVVLEYKKLSESEWHTEKYSMKETTDHGSEIDLDFKIISLTSNTSLLFHIKTINSEGESEASRNYELKPENIIPGAPNHVVKSFAKSDSIKITWEKPIHNPVVVDRYWLHYKPAEYDEATWIAKKTENCECTVTELKPNARYHFRVQAMNRHLYSEEIELVVQTPPSRPPKPKLPKAVPQGELFKLHVELPAIKECGSKVTKLHVHHYTPKLEQYRTEDFDIETEESQKRYKQEMRLNIDETQWVSVSLSNGVGQSEQSDLAPLSAGGVTPGKPTDLKVCDAQSREAELQWKVPKKNGNAASYYEVSVKKKIDTNWKLLKDCKISQTRSHGSLTYHTKVAGLDPVTSYEFSIRAVNNTTKDIVAGECCTIEAKTAMSCPDKPCSPTVNLLDECKAKFVITMLCKERMNGSNVNKIILYCNNKELLTTDLTKEEQEKTEIEKTAIIPSLEDPSIATYDFRIRMANKKGESEPSDAFSLSVSLFKPGPPDNLRITTVSAHSLRVAWDLPIVHPAIVTQYHLQYYLPGHELFKNELYTVENECNLGGLLSNENHTIKVKAVALKNSKSKSVKIEALTGVIYPGPPSSLCADKIGSDRVKIRWRKPRENPQEVEFYLIELRKDDDITVIKTKRVLGTSTVLKELESYTTYTVSVSSCNDNKRRNKNSIRHERFSTKMSKTAKKALQLVSLPSVAVPIVLGYSQSPDLNIDDSDDEYPVESNIYPGPPEELTVMYDCGRRFKIEWKEPRRNSNVLWYYIVRILKEKNLSETKQIKCFYPQSSIFFIFLPNKEYTIRVTSINWKGEEDPKGATTETKAVFNSEKNQLLAEAELF